MKRELFLGEERAKENTYSWVSVYKLCCLLLKIKVCLLWIKEARAKDPMYECRCDERLKTKSEKSTRLTYTGLFGELEHLKIKTRLINEMFASVMGEYVFLKW